MGALGIVTQYTVQLSPKYRLKEKVYPAKLNDILDNLETHIKENRNFELFPFFYSDMTLVKTLNITEEAITTEEPPALSDDFLLSLGITLSGNSGSRTEKVQSIVSGLLEPTERVGDSYKIYPSVRNVKFNEMEYELPREKAVVCLREIMAACRKNQFPIFFPLEMRTVKSDNFWLSPFYGRETVSISVHHYNQEDYNQYFPTFDAIFKKHEGRPHWGKLSYCTQEDFKKLYPKYDNFVKIRNELDPTRRFSNDYITKIFG
jgi:FAD/FMN-containing dehydrogenase